VILTVLSIPEDRRLWDLAANPHSGRLLGAPVCALLLRGAAFEFRYEARFGRRFWDTAFAAGSFVATFVQGAALGALAAGLPMQNGDYAGGAFGCVTLHRPMWNRTMHRLRAAGGRLAHQEMRRSASRYRVQAAALASR
jgi:hypothetical protein